MLIISKSIKNYFSKMILKSRKINYFFYIENEILAKTKKKQTN